MARAARSCSAASQRSARLAPSPAEESGGYRGYKDACACSTRSEEPWAVKKGRERHQQRVVRGGRNSRRRDTFHNLGETCGVPGTTTDLV